MISISLLSWVKLNLSFLIGQLKKLDHADLCKLNSSAIFLFRFQSEIIRYVSVKILVFLFLNPGPLISIFQNDYILLKP